MPPKLTHHKRVGKGRFGLGSDIEERIVQAMRVSALGDGAVHDIAHATHSSESAVYKAADGRRKSCWIEAAQWTQGALSSGKPECEALAPLMTLHAIFTDAMQDDGESALLHNLGSILRSAGRAVDEALAAIEDNDVTTIELRQWRNAITELRTRVAVADRVLEAKEAETRERTA